MLDDFRNADAGIFQDDTTAPELSEEPQPQDALGMTPVQRFVLALMFFFSMFLLGTVCLLITQRIWLPL